MGGPKGINWEQALEFYLTPDFEGKIPSYQDVANKFGVSKKEVGLRAKRENWLQRRQNVYDTAEETYAENRVELIKQTVDIPTLRAAGIERIQKDHCGKSLVADCRKILSGLLPFTENEMEFLDQVLDKGKIAPELLIDDTDMQDRIRRHPLLEWKAMNVRTYKK